MAVIAKQYSKESFYLRELQGSANIVHLIDSFDDSQIGCTILIEELLQSFHEFWDYRRHTKDLFGFGVGFILDGLAALQQLREKNIVHRDISPNNIMFSPIDGMWKLLDFESA